MFVPAAGPNATASRPTTTSSLRTQILDTEMKALPKGGESETLLYGGQYRVSRSDSYREVTPHSPRRKWAWIAIIPLVFIGVGIFFSRSTTLDDGGDASAAPPAGDDDDRPAAAIAAPSDDTAPVALGSLPFSGARANANADDDDADADECGGDDGVEWELTRGGYREACGGARGNLASFSSLSLEAALSECCAAPNCAGLSFNNATGDGVYKRNLDCGISASPVHDGYAKVASIAADDPEDGGCGPWDAVRGGYHEACRGDAGNIEGFQGLALADAERGCCAASGCEGFSYDNATGNGVYKDNLNCGITTSDVYDGYSIRKAPAALPRRGSLVSRSGFFPDGWS